MKRKNFIKIGLLLALLFPLGACAKDGSQPKEDKNQGQESNPVVVTSTDILYDFTRAIAKDAVTVKGLMAGVVDAHHWEPKPADMQLLHDASLLVINGAHLEHWLEEIQPSLPKDLTILDSSEHLDLIKGKEEAEDSDHDQKNDNHEHADHDDHDHHHGGVDPHVWTSPKQAKKQAETIYQGLCQRFPEKGKVFDQGWAQLSKKFDTLIKKYDQALQGASGKGMIVPHLAFSYLARDYGLNQQGLQGLLADGQLSAERVKEIIDFAQKEKLHTIFYDAYGDKGEAMRLAQEMKAEALPLYTLESISETDRKQGADYFTLMEKNLQSLVNSFQ